MATLPLKASRKEQRSVIHFLWAKRRCPNTIHSEMRPVYVLCCVRECEAGACLMTTQV